MRTKTLYAASLLAAMLSTQAWASAKKGDGLRRSVSACIAHLHQSGAIQHFTRSESGNGDVHFKYQPKADGRSRRLSCTLTLKNGNIEDASMQLNVPGTGKTEGGIKTLRIDANSKPTHTKEEWNWWGDGTAAEATSVVGVGTQPALSFQVGVGKRTRLQGKETAETVFGDSSYDERHGIRAARYNEEGFALQNTYEEYAGDTTDEIGSNIAAMEIDWSGVAANDTVGRETDHAVLQAVVDALTHEEVIAISSPDANTQLLPAMASSLKTLAEKSRP